MIIMMYKNYDDYKIIQMWKKDSKILLDKVYPDATEEEIDGALAKVVNNHIKIEEIKMNNTYEKREFVSDTIDFTEYYFKKYPCAAGNGVLFDRDKFNPALSILENWRKSRTNYKKLRKQFDEDSFEFKLYDLYQGNEKVKMNAWYGINGAATSLFFNLECATAITSKGRELISTATCAFEGFLGDNVAFLDMNDVLIYIKNVLSEKKKRKLKDKDWLDRNMTAQDVMNRIKSNLDEECKDFDEPMVRVILNNCDQEELNRLYYKNNIFKLFDNSKRLREIYREGVMSVDQYVIPEEWATPEPLKSKLNLMWEVLNEYVLYNYNYIDKVFRVKNKTRRVALVIDTDSNMVYLDPWIEYVNKNIMSKEDIESKENKRNYRHVLIYTMCYELAKMIRTVLHTYLSSCNVLEEKIPRLDMKNEYLFFKMLITKNKKNYASTMEFKEGQDMHNKLDVKGLAIQKSSTNRNASKIFKKILKEQIMQCEGSPNLAVILEELEQFENEIRESLLKGEDTYLKPVSVKSEEAYEDPYAEQGVRGALLWNALNDENQIVFPDDFYIVKMTLLRKEDCALVQDREVREIIMDCVFNNPNPKISSKGVAVLGIPRDTKVPKWAIPFIDTDQIVEDTMRSFLPVMHALGVESIYTNSEHELFSNYIAI